MDTKQSKKMFLPGSIKRITEFLNAFSMSCSGRLAGLNSKLCLLERKVAFLEAKVEIFDKKKVPQSQSKYVLSDYYFLVTNMGVRRSFSGGGGRALWDDKRKNVQMKVLPII